MTLRFLCFLCSGASGVPCASIVPSRLHFLGCVSGGLWHVGFDGVSGGVKAAPAGCYEKKAHRKYAAIAQTWLTFTMQRCANVHVGARSGTRSTAAAEPRPTAVTTCSAQHTFEEPGSPVGGEDPASLSYQDHVRKGRPDSRYAALSS